MAHGAVLAALVAPGVKQPVLAQGSAVAEAEQDLNWEEAKKNEIYILIKPMQLLSASVVYQNFEFVAFV